MYIPHDDKQNFPYVDWKYHLKTKDIASFNQQINIQCFKANMITCL